MKIPKFLKRKRNIWIIAILFVVILAVIFIIFRPKTNNSIQTDVVLRKNLQETVLATGQVVSGTDLSLSFQSGGVVKRILVKEGDAVVRGQILANLDQSSALAGLTSAKGTLAQYQATYEKLITGSSDGEVASYQIALDGANKDALNSLNDASLKSYNALASVINLQNTYFKGFDGDARNAKLQIEKDVALINSSLNKARLSGLQEDIDSALLSTISSLNSISNSLAIIRSTLDTSYYYGIVPDSEKQTIDTQRANINSALTSATTYQQAVLKAKISLLQSVPEINVVEAQILYAEGQVASAQIVLNNTTITAPASGTITKVDIKVGEQATALNQAIALQDTDSLHAEANVSEANIASIQLGQSIDYTFDALGADIHFEGKVLTINPASTVISGVVNYLLKGSLDNILDIKPGMTANMSILVAQKENALAVPSTAVINKDRKKYVRVVNDQKNLTYNEIEVKTGIQADGGFVEILEGLNEGETIITYMK